MVISWEILLHRNIGHVSTSQAGSLLYRIIDLISRVTENTETFMKKFIGDMRLFLFLVTILFITACGSSHNIQAKNSKKIKLITLDPGHFHAALVQKSMYANVDSTRSEERRVGKECSSCRSEYH